jgi:hypothetical protein
MHQLNNLERINSEEEEEDILSYHDDMINDEWNDEMSLI